MKHFRNIVFFSFVTFIYSACGGGGGTESPDSETGETTELLLDQAVIFTADQTTEIYQQNTDNLGAEIAIDNPSSSLLDFKFKLPAAVMGSNEVFSIKQVEGNLRPNSGVFTGQSFQIETENTEIFSIPLAVDIPYDLNDGPPVLYYVNNEGSLEFVRPGKFDESSNSFRFYIHQPGTYTVIAQSDSSARAGKDIRHRDASVITGFLPAVDGFQIDNNGSFINRGGECSGMTAFARWYFLNYKNAAKEGLYSRYMCTVLQPEQDGSAVLLTGQNLIATRSFISVTQLWQEFISDLSEDVLYRAGFDLIFDALANTQKPVFIYLSSSTMNPEYNDATAHSVLAIAANSATGIVEIYDPNFNGELKQIQFTGEPGNRVYVPYNGFENIGLEGSAYPVVEPMEMIITDAESAFGGSGYDPGEDCPPYSGTTQAKIRILSHQPAATVNSRVVTISGDVDSNQLLVGRISILINSTVFGPVDLKPGLFGFDTFDVPVVLTKGENRLRFITEGKDSDGQYVQVANDYDFQPDFKLSANIDAAIANVTLSWNKEADIDLVVISPDGDYSDYNHPQMSSGGSLNLQDDFRGPENWSLESSDTVIYDLPYRIRAHYYSTDEEETPAIIVKTTLSLNEGSDNFSVTPYSSTLTEANALNDKHDDQGADWVDIAEFTLAKSPVTASGLALDGTLVFYAENSQTATNNDYSREFVVNQTSDLILFAPNSGCLDIVNSDNEYSGHCVHIKAEITSQEDASTLNLQMRLSRLLTPGSYSFHDPDVTGNWASLGASTSNDTIDSAGYGGDIEDESTLTITEFGLQPGDHISGTVDAKLRGGIQENAQGVTYGRFTGSFDFIVPDEE